MERARRRAPKAANARGVLITLEGVEGAGKSTQMTRLAAWLEGLGVPVVPTSEPDGSPLGPWVR